MSNALTKPTSSPNQISCSDSWGSGRRSISIRSIGRTLKSFGSTTTGKPLGYPSILDGLEMLNLPSNMIARLRAKLRAVILPLVLMGMALMTAPILQGYYPIEQLKVDLIRTGRRVGRRASRELNSLINY